MSKIWSIILFNGEKGIYATFLIASNKNWMGEIFFGYLLNTYRTHSYLGACAYTTTGRKYVLITKYFQMCLYKEGDFIQ